METKTYRSKWHKARHNEAEARKRKVRALRAKGKSWPEIADILMVTPQRAQQLGRKT